MFEIIVRVEAHIAGQIVSSQDYNIARGQYVTIQGSGDNQILIGIIDEMSEFEHDLHEGISE